MIQALNEYKILGLKTSKKFMTDVLEHPEFINGNTYTDFIEKHMNNRELDEEKYKQIGASVSSLVDTAQTQVVMLDGSGAIPSPWETLGAIQIGDSIHE